MKKVKIKLRNVIDNSELPEMMLDRIPVEGDPVEIEKEMYYVCETKHCKKEGSPEVGVIPLVVRNPSKVANIGNYINCLTIAQRRVQFRKDNNICDFNDCDEMEVS